MKADTQISRSGVSYVPSRDTQKKATSNEMASSLGLYVTRWQRWAVAGLQGIRIDGLSRYTYFPSTEPEQSN